MLYLQRQQHRPAFQHGANPITDTAMNTKVHLRPKMGDQARDGKRKQMAAAETAQVFQLAAATIQAKPALITVPQPPRPPTPGGGPRPGPLGPPRPPVPTPPPSPRRRESPLALALYTLEDELLPLIWSVLAL
jgi:hypothetical protein